ncbi:MAG: low temperature requirement protein A [Acidipropionibacterium jensenii]|uniref:low temperature requirement protein A n=1 Tax=Acidipropionibacterium jensenii TaxID=1749 RepID=UPI0026485BCE|nr:low temperature requirement protein A [Acidipropionibacterium jensenii]MDN6443068.1 low temperature requirement protein A [Acidipropionibacterium jensenii]
MVAVSVASSQLHHQLADREVLNGVLIYAVAFFGIWWAWMNFTWFATSFAVDDWLYRVVTIVQMGGVLVLAAGIEPAFEHHDFRLLVWAYVVMRVAMVVQWVRAAVSDRALRTTTISYALGIAITQALWIVMLGLPGKAIPVAIPVLILAELAVPVIAERHHATPWHPHHITERYGLFTLIVLGESVLASANAIIEALHTSREHAEAAARADLLGSLVGLSALTLITSAALWWIYFWPPHHGLIGSLRESLRYGYVHYVVFAAAAAFSAGIEVHIDALTGESELSRVAVGYTVSIPVAVFVLAIWWIALSRFGDRLVNTTLPLGAAVILLSPLLPFDVAATAVVLVLIVVVLVWRRPVERNR